MRSCPSLQFGEESACAAHLYSGSFIHTVTQIPCWAETPRPCDHSKRVKSHGATHLGAEKGNNSIAYLDNVPVPQAPFDDLLRGRNGHRFGILPDTSTLACYLLGWKIAAQTLREGPEMFYWYLCNTIIEAHFAKKIVNL